LLDHTPIGVVTLRLCSTSAHEAIIALRTICHLSRMKVSPAAARSMTSTRALLSLQGRAMGQVKRHPSPGESVVELNLTAGGPLRH
jgi:hypothetical protein